MTLSDGEGAFAFDSLPAGRYQLHGSKARYVDTRWARAGPARRAGRSIWPTARRSTASC